MMYPFCQYSDETLVTFSNIVKNENDEEFLYVHFERPMEYGFDSIRFDVICITGGELTHIENAFFPPRMTI